MLGALVAPIVGVLSPIVGGSLRETGRLRETIKRRRRKRGTTFSEKNLTTST